MKYSEFHRILKANGWILDTARGNGSHRIYKKGTIVHVVPFHGSKEIGNDFAKKILKEMGIVL